MVSYGVDVVCGCSFDDYDYVIDIGFVWEKWLMIKGCDVYIVVYVVFGGLDVWWLVCVDYIIIRVWVVLGMVL